MAPTLRRIRSGAARAALVLALGLGVVVASVAPASAATSSGGHAHRNQLEAFARLGDCTAPTEGVTCHFVSVEATMHSVQLEFTTIEVQDGQEVFVDDTQCTIEKAKVTAFPKEGVVEFASFVPASDCELLTGAAPADHDIDVRWTADGPLTDGDNACTVDATVDGVSVGAPIFCNVLA